MSRKWLTVGAQKFGLDPDRKALCEEIRHIEVCAYIYSTDLYLPATADKVARVPEALKSDAKPAARGRRPYLSSEQRRADVLEAARKEFVKSGYDGTTVREIAAAADVNDAILYRYFKSKQQIFEEAVAAPLQEAVNHAFTPVQGEWTSAESASASSRNSSTGCTRWSP
jgi:hypothetical protein